VPGEFDSKTYTGALDRVAAAAKKHGKSLGMLVTSVEQGIAANKLGFDFICYSGDAWILRNALADAVEKLRAGCAGTGKPEAPAAKDRGRRK
jgi:2-dehydro-3-deoxyglucarate aldolase/4-hydroxy-2-oxoheptanedioate aldolase